LRSANVAYTNVAERREERVGGDTILAAAAVQQISAAGRSD